jgi:hypothetical protein
MIHSFSPGQDFLTGFARGLRRGYHGEKVGTDDEHAKSWAGADEDDAFRRGRGEGYRAGFRYAKLGQEYCSQNFFCCETCSHVNKGRDCHNNPILNG